MFLNVSYLNVITRSDVEYISAYLYHRIIGLDLYNSKTPIYFLDIPVMSQ